MRRKYAVVKERVTMKLLLALGKIRKGCSGRWRSLKAGEPIEDGDLEYGMTFVTDVAERQVGTPVKKGESIIRLEFDK